jgi:beta-galactosidase GanA
MVQVENEVGVIPESRDHSAVANAAFQGKVPALLTQYLTQHHTTLQPELRSAWEQAGAKTSGSWQEVFGSSSLTDDLFMAWHFATYIQDVTSAGKKVYPLPMYTNAALIRPNYEPGQYNSGGPLPHSLDLWRAAAPALNFLSPDIYFNEFSYWAGRYSLPGNPLFIPEAQLGTAGAANALYAFGKLNAIGFSAFGIDDQGNAPLDLVGITRPGETPDVGGIASVYQELESLTPQILEAQRTGKVTAALLEGDAQRAARVRIGDYIAEIKRAGNGPALRTGVLLIQQSPDEFLISGVGDAQLSFTSDKPGPPIVGIESIDEHFFRNGTWKAGRRLNGDENGQGQILRIYPTDLNEGRIYRVRLYRYR